MDLLSWIQDLLIRIHALITGLAGLRVFALVGPSGTGKSFRARLIADRFHIRYILDDGILIRGQKIIAGRSAKRETAYLTAVKTALYVDPAHRREVRSAIGHYRPRQILVMGTSDKMILKICDHLGLPKPFRTIYIQDIASPEEIKIARENRLKHGRHVIPVPSREISQTEPAIVDDLIRVWSRWGLFRRERIYEKTIVRPLFSPRDPVQISQRSLRRAIRSTLAAHLPGCRIERINILYNEGYDLAIELAPPPGADFAIDQLQSGLRSYLEKQNDIFIRRLIINPKQPKIAQTVSPDV